MFHLGATTSRRRTQIKATRRRGATTLLSAASGMRLWGGDTPVAGKQKKQIQLVFKAFKAVNALKVIKATINRKERRRPRRHR